MNRQYLIIHHTGAEEKDTDQIRRYHKSLGWRDIGYNFVIEKSGLVVPGRTLDQPGAHCRAGGMNTRGIGIALIGNLEEHPPCPEQVDALIDLLRRLMKQHQIPAENVLGHREVPGAATACPGRYLPLEQVQADLNRTTPPPQTGVDSTQASTDRELPSTEPGVDVEKHVPGLWLVQVGAFSTRERAEDFILRLKEKGIEAFIVKGNRCFF
ncbi:MAG: N-acetylmuramoyl-L-alanine amidase [Desulfotomaculaceae bacterium]